jgi:glycosyltransferase involved in cell wall biosynthesis
LGEKSTDRPLTPLKAAWISDFPVEWLSDPPPEVLGLPRHHPATWQLVLREEFDRAPEIKLHIVLLRRRIARSFTFDRGNTTFHVLKASALGRLASGFWLDTMLIRRTFERVQPDVVHAWGMEKGAGITASRLHRPYLMTVQGLFAWYKEITPLNRFDTYMERLERLSLKRAPTVSAESTFAVSYLKAKYPGKEILHAEVAPNPLFFQVKRNPDQGIPHFVTVGTLGHRKGTEVLMHAFGALAQDQHFKATIITSSTSADAAHFSAALSEAVKNRLVFVHSARPDQIAKVYETATLALLPTRADTGPVAAKEAAVAGVPVIGSAVGGMPDYIVHGKNGFLSPPGDADAFVANIRQALRDPMLGAGKVDAEGLARTRTYLSPQTMAANFLSIYRHIAKRKAMV